MTDIPDAAIEAATDATAIHLFQVDRRLKGLTPVDWKYATDFERAYFRAEAVLALEAAMPAIREALAQEIEHHAIQRVSRIIGGSDEHRRLMIAFGDAARIVRGGAG